MTSAVSSHAYNFSTDSLHPTANTDSIEPVIIDDLLQDRDFVTGFSIFQQSRDYQLNKVYQFGFLQKKNDSKSKSKSNQRSKWTGWFAELTGLTLNLWPASSPTECLGPRLQTIKKRKCHSFNVTDCNVFTIQFAGSPNAFVVNISGANHLVFQTATIAELQSWVLAFRLANIETSLLNEYYTALVYHSTKHRNLFKLHISEYSFSGWVELRCTGMQKWTRLWMTVHNQLKPFVTFSPASHSPEFLFKVTSLHQAYMLYPGHPTLVEQSSNLRLEGEILTSYDPSVQQNNPTFLILSSSSQNDVMTILLSLYNAFQIPTLPSPSSFSPLNIDTNEIMSAPVIGVTYKETHLSVLDIWRNKVKAIPTMRSMPRPRPRERKIGGLQSARNSSALNDSRPLSFLPPKSRKSAVVTSKNNSSEANLPTLSNNESSLSFSFDELLSGLDKEYYPLDTTLLQKKSGDSIELESDASPITPVAFDELTNLYPEFKELTEISDFTAQLKINDPAMIERSCSSPIKELEVEKPRARPRPQTAQPSRARPFSLASVFSSRFTSPFSKKSDREKNRESVSSPSSTEETKYLEPPSQQPSDSASSDSLTSNPDDDDSPLGSRFAPMDPTIAYNPALQRPSTLLEVRDYAKYTDQLKNQARIGPLILLPNKVVPQTEAPKTPALTPSPLKTTHQSARPRLNSDSRNFERRHNLPPNYRSLVTQSHVYPHEVNYKNFAPDYSQLNLNSPYRHMDGSKSAKLTGMISDFDKNKFKHNNPLASQSQGEFASQAIPRSRQNVSLATRQAHCQSYTGYQKPSPLASRTMDNLISSYSPPSSKSSKKNLTSSSIESFSHAINDKDEVPVGVLMGKKPSNPPKPKPLPPSSSHQPTLIKGKYRDHAASQTQLNSKHPSIDEESDLEIDGDIEDTFEDFLERHIKPRSGAQLTSASLFQVFFQYCQTVDCDFEEIPSPSTFNKLMRRAGYTSKSVPKLGTIWCNIAVINSSDSNRS